MAISTSIYDDNNSPHFHRVVLEMTENFANIFDYITHKKLAGGVGENMQEAMNNAIYNFLNKENFAARRKN